MNWGMCKILSKSWNTLALSYSFLPPRSETPEKFYLTNNKSEEGIKALGSGKLPPRNEKYYPKWRPLFEYLKTQINEIIQKSFNRPADFYDVDFFLWYVSDKIKKEKSTDIEQPNRKVESSQINKSNQSEKQLSLTDWFEANGFYFDKKQVGGMEKVYLDTTTRLLKSMRVLRYLNLFWKL
jgi:hypothetical protein